MESSLSTPPLRVLAVSGSGPPSLLQEITGLGIPVTGLTVIVVREGKLGILVQTVEYDDTLHYLHWKRTLSPDLTVWRVAG